MISVIIPFYNHIDLVHSRMNEFMKFIPPNDIEIILIDDDSTENVDGIVAFWQKQVGFHKIRYFKNEKNMGFGYSMNKGADKAKGDILVFLNSDVIIYSDFVSEVSYLTAGDDKVLIGGQLMDFDTGWNRFKSGVVPYLNCWIMACTRTAWEELGGFDPRYGIGDFEDVDLCVTAVQKGFQLIPLTKSTLVHMGGQSFGYSPEREKRTRANRQKFMEKWGLEEIE